MRAWFASSARMAARRTLSLLTVVRVHRAKTVPAYRQRAYAAHTPSQRVLAANTLRTP
jgi:hypothetical protein